MPIKQLSDGSPDGTSIGQSPADKVSLYGVAPVTQRANAVQATSLLSASSYVTVGSNMAAIFTEIANTFTGLGIWKGSA